MYSKKKTTKTYTVCTDGIFNPISVMYVGSTFSKWVLMNHYPFHECNSRPKIKHKNHFKRKSEYTYIDVSL